MHIYDVTNPQGFFCQSKADVKYKQHLGIWFGKLYIIFSSIPVTTCHCRKALKNVKEGSALRLRLRRNVPLL